jgi:hypothetical protein
MVGDGRNSDHGRKNGTFGFRVLRHAPSLAGASISCEISGLREQVEDFLVSLEGRNQVRAGNPKIARATSPIEQAPP